MGRTENFIKSYKLAGLMVGKKNNITGNQIPVISPDEDNQIEDSGVTVSELTSLVNVSPSPSIADLNVSDTILDVINKVNVILQVLRDKNIILP